MSLGSGGPGERQSPLGKRTANARGGGIRKKRLDIRPQEGAAAPSPAPGLLEMKGFTVFSRSNGFIGFRSCLTLSQLPDSSCHL